MRSGQVNTPPFPIEGEVLGGKYPIKVGFADTAEEQQQGLSGTTSLPTKTGKLFIFETPNNHSFWMKDMLYPIDMVWIDENMQIVSISYNSTPESYPKIFNAGQNVKYVLEINAGEAAKNGLSTGTKLKLETIK